MNHYILRPKNNYGRKQHCIVHTDDTLQHAIQASIRYGVAHVVHKCKAVPMGNEANGDQIMGFILMHKPTGKALCGRHSKGAAFLAHDKPPRGYYTNNGAINGANIYTRLLNPDILYPKHDFSVYALAVVGIHSEHPPAAAQPDQAPVAPPSPGPAPVNHMVSVILNSSEPPKIDSDHGDRRFAVFTPPPGPAPVVPQGELPPLPTTGGES